MSSDEPAQLPRGGGQSQCPRRVSFSKSQTGATLQRPCYSAAMAQPGEDFHGFAKFRSPGRVVRLLEVDVAQIGQRSSGTPRISGRPKGGKSLAI